MFENVPDGFQVVDPSSLSGKGERTYVPLVKGDRIAVGNRCFSKPFVDKTTGETRETFFIEVTLNGKDHLLPTGTFRRFPKAVEDLIPKYPVMRELYSGDDLSRFNALKGRTLEVKEVLEGEFLDFEKCDFQSSPKVLVWKTATYPAFVEVK